MNLLARDLWQEVREAFRAARGAAVADLWLQQTWPVDFAKGVFTLAVPNAVVGEWMDHQYRDALESIFRDLTGSAVKVRLRVEESLPAVTNEVPSAPVETPSPFVIRPENKLASAAVQRLLREPASGNPLFLHGPAGVGKSSLIHHHLQKFAADQLTARSTLTVHAESFSQGLVKAIKEGTVAEFRGRMLAADAFVLEEAHRLRSKPRTQKEFLTVLRYHIERRRPVILTSRHTPNAIFLLDEVLRSYFLSGIVVRITDYAQPSRVAILEAHAKRFHRAVPQETVERIVQRVQGTFDRQVRFLEKVAAFAALESKPATIEVLSDRFPELQGTGQRDIDLRSLIDRVSLEFGTTAEDIASNRKVRSAVLGRHVVIYLATVVFNLRARRVVRHLGGLSPSTPAYARRKVEQRRREDPIFDAQVRKILEELEGGQQLLF